MPTNNNEWMGYILNMMKGGQTPKQVVMNVVKDKMNQDPLGQNIMNLANNKKEKEIEMIARNICKEKGVDFDKEFNSFKRMLGL